MRNNTYLYYRLLRTEVCNILPGVYYQMRNNTYLYYRLLTYMIVYRYLYHRLERTETAQTAPRCVLFLNFRFVHANHFEFCIWCVSIISNFVFFFMNSLFSICDFFRMGCFWKNGPWLPKATWRGAVWKKAGAGAGRASTCRPRQIPPPPDTWSLPGCLYIHVVGNTAKATY